MRGKRSINNLHNISNISKTLPEVTLGVINNFGHLAPDT